VLTAIPEAIGDPGFVRAVEARAAILSRAILQGATAAAFGKTRSLE
jgi:hypothetical protein